jgi:hypothetical protein
MAAFGASACEPVTTTPATLSNGVFCLVADVEVVSQPAFELGDNSVLDCQGHRVSFLLQPPYPDDFRPWAIAISGSNAVVRNCVVDGGYVGIHALGDYFRIQGNTVWNSVYYAIETSGVDGGLIEGNLIHSIAGAGRDGMIKTAGLVDIVGNVLFSVEGRTDIEDGGRIGISVDGGRGGGGGLVAGNILRNILPSPGSVGAAIKVVYGCPVIYHNVLSAVPDRGVFGVSGQPSGCVSALNTIVGYSY